jgi:hypothetical protein
MTKAVCFHNSGILDHRAFTMLGLSAKQGEQAVGFFGTGFKYAIATLLRNGCGISVSTAYTQYTFTVQKGNFREQEHNFIKCTARFDDNREDHVFELPYTTHLGTNWKVWQAYRELYTNCVIDELGGATIIDLDADDLTDDKLQLDDVCVYVSGDEFLKVHEQHDKYFINPNRPTIATTLRMRCVAKHDDSDNVVYYKSMYTGSKLDKPALFTYDYVTTVTLTEDRTIADMWYIKDHILAVWLTRMDYDTLIHYLPLAADRDIYEHDLNNAHYEGPSEDFLRACKHLIEHRHIIPLWAHELYLKSRPFDEQVMRQPLTKFQQKKLQHAVDVLRHHGCIVDINLVVACTSLPEDLMGMYKDGTIYLSRELFDKGEMMILGTLYEEWMHEHHRCEDMTRKMQNLLVDRVAILMEQLYDIETA